MVCAGCGGTIAARMVLRALKPGDKAVLHDKDYDYKDGSYFVRAVSTEFSADGGKRTVELGYRLT